MKDERLGLLLIASSLLVIALISGLFLKSQSDLRQEQNRSQGLSLVRLLSSLPSEHLLPPQGRQGALEVVKTSQGNPDFAYGVVVSLRGEPLVQAARPGVTVPPAPLPSEPAAWIGERVLDFPEGRTVYEFFAPVLRDGQRVAHVRIGFFEPGYAIFPKQASFFGLLALPIFLLTPLAYFLMRREVQPVAAACGQLDELLDGQRFAPVRIEAKGEIGDFIRSFNRFVELAEGRARELEARESEALASCKVLTYQKARIESVLETLPDAALVLDETGAVIFANVKLESILGVGLESAVGHKAPEWCADASVVDFLANYQGPQPRLRRTGIIEFSPASSPDRQIAVSAHPLAEAANAAAVSGTLVLFRDATAATLARRAQGEFVTHVAHELKAPLNVMAMYSETLLEKDGGSEDFQIEACNVIKDEVERAFLLVNSLLTITRIETGALVLDRQRVRLQDFLGDALTAVSRGSRGADLKFELDVPSDFAPIYVDKELLRVALNNLLTNAIKYNRDGGEVRLSSEDTRERIFIRVQDSGIGIAEDEQRYIFQKFYRSEDPEVQRRGGHGLGLPLAQAIVELHGGQIEMESVPGEGSVFSIVFKKTPALVKEQTRT